MASKVEHIWNEWGLPISKAAEVSDYAINITAFPALGDGTLQTGLAGYVEGGKGWETESDLERLDSEWMGAKMAQNCAAINCTLGVAARWMTERP